MYQKLEFDSQLVRFRCNTDCKNDPENCIGERLFRAMGDMLVLGGFQVTFDKAATDLKFVATVATGGRVKFLSYV